MATMTSRPVELARPVQPARTRSTAHTTLICVLAALAGLSQFAFYLHAATWHGIAMAILCPLAGLLFVLWFRDARRGTTNQVVTDLLDAFPLRGHRGTPECEPAAADHQ